MSNSTSLKGHIISQAIAIVGFVLLPIVVTLMVPFTDLTFRRDANGASVTVTRYVLMFIPWQTTEVANVKTIRADVNRAFRYRNTVENRRKGRVGTVSHATGQVVAISDAHEVIVQAAPEIAHEIAARFERFVAESAGGTVLVPVYASWSLSYLLGGTMTALAALYAISAILAILALPFNWLRRAG